MTARRIALVAAAIGFFLLVFGATYVANGALDADDSTHAVVLRNEGAAPVGVRIVARDHTFASYELPAQSEVTFRPPEAFRTIHEVTFLDATCEATGLVGFGGGEASWSDLAMLIPWGNGAVGVLHLGELDAWRQSHEPLPSANALAVSGCPAF